MADAKQIAQTLVRIGEDPRVFGLTMSERNHALAASVLLPELLDACAELVSQLGEHGGGIGSDCALCVTIGKAKRAIAKATGGAS